eukprot:3109099-Pyramimonas_sp.AAC.1
MEGGWCSTCGSRLSAARIRVKSLQEFHGLRACRCRHVALALAPRTFVKHARASRIEDGPFSTCGSR